MVVHHQYQTQKSRNQMYTCPTVRGLVKNINVVHEQIRPKHRELMIFYVNLTHYPGYGLPHLKVCTIYTCHNIRSHNDLCEIIFHCKLLIFFRLTYLFVHFGRVWVVRASRKIYIFSASSIGQLIFINDGLPTIPTIVHGKRQKLN